MAELHASLVPFERLAPVLITTLAGPAARLAISVLADAIEELTGEDTPAKLDTVRDRIDALPGKLIAPVLQKAEAAIEEVLPAAPVEPQVRAEEPIVASPTITAPTTQSAPVSVPESGTVTVQPVQPAPSGIDRFIPAGWKTAIGIAVYVVASVGMTLGYLPADVATALMTVGGGLAGYGVIAKIERWLPVFAGFMKIRKA